MNNESQLWQNCLDNLAIAFSPDVISILKTASLTEQQGIWTLHTLNKIAQHQIEKNYLEAIKLALEKLVHLQNRKIKKLQVVFSPPTLFEERSTTTTKTFESNIKTEFNFNNFIAGPSNDKAYVAAKRVGTGALDLNPLVIYGGTGLGKSHLMHATGNALKSNGKKVLYITAETFTNDFIKALQNKKINDFNDLYRSVDVLLIDDVQFLSGKDRSQEEFFHTFNSLFDQKRQIILTCDRFIKEVEGLEQRLISRFGNGLNVSVVPPGFETRVAILQSKANQLDFNLPNDVAMFVAENIKSNVRELEGALKSIYAASLFHHREITLEEAKNAIEPYILSKNKQLTLQNIQNRVANYYQIKTEDLLSNTRKSNIALPRQVAMALAMELTKHSTTEIGKAFNRDHTTVLHANNKIQQLKQASTDFLNEYKDLTMILTG